MGKKLFLGGVHPDGHKELSCECPLTPYLPKGEMNFLLGQHIGKPADPIVKKNDEVLAGQIIAQASGFISANIVSSCSGKVKTVSAHSILIENDGQYTLAEGIGERSDLNTLTKEEIINKVKNAGIVGLGGAGFPTYVKLMPGKPEAIDYIIANGAECEPYITCDDRLMQEKPEEIIGGMLVFGKVFPDAKLVVAIEDNKPKAIAAMKKAAENTPVVIKEIEARYPQGGERTIIQSVTRRKLAAGKLPADLGCIVDNVATIAAVYKAVVWNTPLMERGFTVTGDAVAEPKNLIVKIGTPLQELIDACGGFKSEAKKIILGGPMMGMSIADLSVPSQKNNNALVALLEDEVELANEKATTCIRCGKCVQACPIGLYPQLMAQAAKKKDFARYEKIYGLQCMQCGSCTYACPAKRPLMETFKLMRAQIMANKAKEAK